MHLVGRILLDTDEGSLLAEKRVQLLEAIEQSGTIQKAATQLGLSYKGAWDAVNAMNNLCDQPLVERQVGGRRGGGSQLTEQGRNLIHLYRTVEAEYQRFLDRLGDGLSDIQQLNRVMNRFAMKTSARNQFHGKVSALIQGDVSCEVRMRLDDRTEIVAVITNESAENLDLRIGTAVFALIKAPSVVLLQGERCQVSARNRLHGEIAELQRGAVNTEVRVELPGGKSVIAVASNPSCDAMELQPGQPIWAVFKSSNVVLARVG